MKGCARHMEAYTFEAAHLGLVFVVIVSLTQATEETQDIGRRPPSDWHVVKCMGRFLD